MSCDYANGLSPYENKGILGVPEKFDSPEKIKEKCSLLAQMIKNAKHVVVHTGAGISTSAGIPDFRGPKGVWTLEEKGLKPDMNISFADAKPTKTHMALKELADRGLVHYVITQNIDGLHLKSGLERSKIAELHGNMFVDQCNVCKRQFTRKDPSPTVGQKHVGLSCPSGKSKGRPCRGKLHDTILDWEHSLPDDDLDMADMHSSIADLSICMGTTLQIVPSGNLPLNTLRYGGKMVICNLQPTKHNNKADLIINGYIDTVIDNVMNELNIPIPEHSSSQDPTSSDNMPEWTISKIQLQEIKLLYKQKCGGKVKKRTLVKSNIISKKQTNRKKVKKEEDSDEEEAENTTNKTDDIIENHSLKSEDDAMKKVKTERESDTIPKEENGKNEKKIQEKSSIVPTDERTSPVTNVESENYE